MYRAAFFAVLFAALFPVMMAGQVTVSGATVGRVTGTVLDVKGKSLAGTTVTLSAETSALRRTAKTDKKGNYRFDDVPVGHYTLTAELPEFVTTTRPAVLRETAPEANVRFFLSAAAPLMIVPKPERAPRPVLVPYDR